jgi:arylsulfatase A-like enzyme
LKQLELDNRTIVIFCSDNGANQHGNNGILKGSKGSVWEGGHRVPAIIRWPGHIQAGIISTEIVLSMDFFPTILELAGIESSKEFDGISIAQHLLDNKSLPKRTVFWQHGDSYAVRDGKWKLIFFRENEPPKLYNLDTDIKEIFDISNKHPDVVSKLVNELKQWKENVFFEGIYKNSN